MYSHFTMAKRSVPACWHGSPGGLASDRMTFERNAEQTLHPTANRLTECGWRRTLERGIGGRITPPSSHTILLRRASAGQAGPPAPRIGEPNDGIHAQGIFTPSVRAHVRRTQAGRANRRPARRNRVSLVLQHHRLWRETASSGGRSPLSFDMEKHCHQGSLREKRH